MPYSGEPLSMKKITIILLALVLGACAYKHQPIQNFNEAMPAPAQSLPNDRIETLIVESGQVYGWKFQHSGPGHLIATQANEKFSAVVDIYFDQKTWRIVYQSSVGFNEKNGEIHSHYNLWVRNLEHEISSRLTNSGFTEK